MDKITRRYIKVNKDGQINKKHLKNKEKLNDNNKSKFEQLLLDFKQRKNIQNQTKITSSERNIVNTGIFSNVLRSDVVSRSDAPKLSEESRQDLLKLIGLRPSQNNIVNSSSSSNLNKSVNESDVLKRFCNNLCLNSPNVCSSQKYININKSDNNLECASDNKSIVKIINEKYEKLINDSLNSENENCMDLDNTNVEKLFDNKMEQLEDSDIWEEQSSDILEQNKTKDYRFSTMKSILQEQKQIVEDCTSSDLVTNYKDTPVSNTMKRKFIKRFNEMTLINNGQSEIHYNSVESDGLKVQPQGFSTPIKSSIFPETSYHTPENQKYVYKVPDSEVYQTVLYVAPENQQKHFKDKVCQKENFIELVVPSSVSNQTGLYEITTKETTNNVDDIVFSPKIEKVKSRNPFRSLENSDKNVLSKWKNQLKHVYECGPKKENIQIDEKTVINLKKNLLFDDCDNILSRPKKICKRNRSSDITLRNIPSSPFSKFITENTTENCNISKSEIRRKLNYSNDITFEVDNFVNLESEDIENLPTSIFTDYEPTTESKPEFNFTKPKSYLETISESKKHKIDYNCKHCSKSKEKTNLNIYKDNYVPHSPVYDERGQPIMVPKSPKYKPIKRFSLEIGESSSSSSKSDYFFERKHFSPIKTSHYRKVNSPNKLELFKNFQGVSVSENDCWKPFEDFTQDNSGFTTKSLSQRSRSPLTLNSQRSQSPVDKRGCCPHCLRSPKRNKLQVVPLSPSEYMLRKKILPHTVTSDMKPKNPDLPVFRLF